MGINYRGLLQEGNCLDIWLLPQNSHVFEAHLLQFLSTSEVERAAQYRYQKDRLGFIIRRGFLRLILGNYLGIYPKNIKLEYTKYGKPYVQSQMPLHFSLSSSDEYAVLAITSVEVGIDIERKTPFESLCDISEEIMPYSASVDFSQYERVELFYKWWTRNEAYHKAVGDGLIGFQYGIGNNIRLDKPITFDEARWIFVDIFSPTNYTSVACLACNWKGLLLRYWKLRGENPFPHSSDNLFNLFSLTKETVIIE